MASNASGRATRPDRTPRRVYGSPIMRDSSNGPMSGLKVLDFSIALTGPYAAALLADQGAEVIKVERPGIGDIARYVGVMVNGMSALYLVCNRGKRSIAVDVQTPEGVDIVRRIAADVDVVIENFRPGVMDRLGLGYADITADNPDVIYASLSGFGDEGPYRDRSAYDTVIQAYGGIAANQADPDDGVPTFLRQTVADKVTALYATQAITAALFARAQGRGGQHVKLAMADAVVSFLWADAAGNEVMLDADGSQASSIATVGERIKNRDVLSPIMDMVYAMAANLTMEEATVRFERERVPFSMILTSDQLTRDPHAVAVGMFEEADHHIAGRTRLPRHPARFGATPAALTGGSPGLGEHTDEILAELGLGDRIAALRERSIVT